mmetsp:Transcript_40197/g.52675  ORF Transcript_40197/g.52675 Transcript_40197/m.52675 type:complete len:86 (-) Transcript_40197:644-901(-)
MEQTKSIFEKPIPAQPYPDVQNEQQLKVAVSLPNSQHTLNFATLNQLGRSPLSNEASGERFHQQAVMTAGPSTTNSYLRSLEDSW